METIAATIPAPTRRRLALVENNCISNDPCALCGERCDPTGLDLVLVEDVADGFRLTGALVCDPCGWEHAPELQGIRRDASRFAGHSNHLGDCCLCGCPGLCRVHDRTDPLAYDDGYTRAGEVDDQRTALTERYGRPATGHDGVQVWPTNEAEPDP